MLLNSNRANNRIGCCSRQRFFLTLLFLNSFLGCIYFIHEQQDQQIDQKSTDTKLWNKLFNSQSQDVLRTTNAMKSIQDILENEYNHDDLIQFYKHVQTEYSLGLKCNRTRNSSQQIERSTTVSSALFSSFNSSTKPSLSDQYQRTDFYKFLIDNSDACLNKPIDLLIIVISKSENYKTRDAIRRTWGSRKNLGIYSSIRIKFFFLIDYDDKLSHSIRLENNLFHDIIQVELPQHYTLVTHRVLSLFEWSFRYCRTAKFLFKTDDDIFINLLLLLKFISPLIKQSENNSFSISDMNIYGYLHPNPSVFRSSSSSVLARYIVTYDEFPCERYPAFLSGFGYLIAKKARDAIFYTAYQDPEPFRISDVYLTGIIPDYLSIPRQRFSNYHIIENDKECEIFFNNLTSFACATGSHRGSSGDTFDKFNLYWQVIRTKHRNSFLI